MILPKEASLTPEQVREVTDILAEYGCSIHPIVGTTRSIYAIIGDERSETMRGRIERLPYINRIDTIQSSFKLMDVRSDLASHEIRIGGVSLRRELLVIAGQCTIDPKNPNLFLETAHAVKEAGAHVLRGGVWKPRTNPYSFQGDEKSLETLMEASRQTGLPVNTEVMEEEHLRLALEANVPMLQIGTRNALNYSLLRKVGEGVSGRDTIVLLKRGRHMGAIEEFLSAAEYVVRFGNPNVVLCPRGTIPTLEGYRSHPDESITPLLKERSWAPVVVDPSHSVGKAAYVEACCLSAIAYGADGLCVETHIDPNRGIGDDPKQSVVPEKLKQIVERAKLIWNLTRN